MKTTNYIHTFIEVAEDCPASRAEVPPTKGDQQTVASIQYALLHDAPYSLTSDDVLFQVYAIRKGIPRKDHQRAWELFFSKGQPCFRSSPLTKRYGWGVHCDGEGRIAVIPVESDEYARLANDKDLKHLKAMRSKRAWTGCASRL